MHAYSNSQRLHAAAALSAEAKGCNAADMSCGGSGTYLHTAGDSWGAWRRPPLAPASPRYEWPPPPDIVSTLISRSVLCQMPGLRRHLRQHDTSPECFLHQLLMLHARIDCMPITCAEMGAGSPPAATIGAHGWVTPSRHVLGRHTLHLLWRHASIEHSSWCSLQQ